jgi:hypothetical protein
LLLFCFIDACLTNDFWITIYDSLAG